MTIPLWPAALAAPFFCAEPVFGVGILGPEDPGAAEVASELGLAEHLGGLRKNRSFSGPSG